MEEGAAWLCQVAGYAQLMRWLVRGTICRVGMGIGIKMEMGFGIGMGMGMGEGWEKRVWVVWELGNGRGRLGGMGWEMGGGLLMLSES